MSLKSSEVRQFRYSPRQGRSTLAFPPAAAMAPSGVERPIGVALIASADLAGGRAYLCDPEGHSIHVLDQDYKPLFSFGGYGSNLGQFDSPTDVAIVWIDAASPTDCTAETAVLVVADRGNNRIQLLELDGAPICAIGGRGTGLSVNSTRDRSPSSQARPVPSNWPIRAGWPFFRLALAPQLVNPSRLEWRAPYLDVACAGAAMVRVDLVAALLPDFRTWMAQAPSTVLRQAFRRFAMDPHRGEIPNICLIEIAERLLPLRRRSVTLPWRARA
jgi:hypothetical protein